MSGAEDRVADGFDLPADPTLTDVLRLLSRIVKLQIRTHVPAKVIAYDPARRRATVEVEHLQVVRVSDPTRIPPTALAVKGIPPNAEATLAPFIIIDAPVSFQGGTMGGLTVPLVPGDEGELHISDRSLSAWLLTGIASDPQLTVTHALQDGVFHPGLRSDPHVGPPTDMTATVLDGAAMVKLGAAAVSAIAKAEELIAAIDAAWAAATPFANDGGANLKTTWLVAWNAQKATIKALKGKVE